MQIGFSCSRVSAGFYECGDLKMFCITMPFVSETKERQALEISMVMDAINGAQSKIECMSDGEVSENLNKLEKCFEKITEH